MNKKLSRILAAFLVLCMLPATLITAFARGKGVFGDSTENQSLNNAPGQYIPETITVDGKLNDTGWPESNFGSADGNTGYWNVEAPDSSVADAKFKYQLRSDIENVYIGASVDMPEGVTKATFNVYFKDTANTSGNNGYTNRIYFDIDTVAKTVICNIESGVKSGESGTKATLAYQKHAFKYVFNGNTVVFEMRNLIEDIFVKDMSTVTFITSLNFDVNGENVGLYHPKTRNDGSIDLFPTFDYWPTGGKAVDTLYSNTADDLPYEVTVDGNFDEAVWSTLTNYYIYDEEHYAYEQNGAADGYASMNGDTEYGTGVKTDNGHYLITNKNTTSGSYYNSGYDSSLHSNDVETNRVHVRFKYELRVDANYLYGAVVAYVPEITPYTDVEGGKNVTVTTSPDLCIYFFDDERAGHPDGYEEIEKDDEEKTAGNSQTGYLPEAILQIRSDVSDYSSDKTIFSTLGNVWPTLYENGNPYKFGWGGAYARPADNNMEATRVERDGNLWNFEFKVELSRVPKDSSGNICFSVFVADRYSVSRSEQQRGCAFTGASINNTTDSTAYLNTYPERDWEGNKNYGNIITAATIQKAKDNNLNVTDKTDFSDGELDQAIWAALSGADNHVDGRERNRTNTTYGSYENYQFENYAYKISADHEYLYGAMILSDGWDANDIVKLWLNRRKTKYELESAYTTDVDEINKNNHGGNRAVESISVKGASPYFTNPYRSADILFDGVKHETACGGEWSHPMFYGWDTDVSDGEVEFVLELSELFASNQLDVYFSGAYSGSTSHLAGIFVPTNTYSIEYSYDGIQYDPVDSTFAYTSTEDTSVGTSDFDSYKYTYTFNEKITARYIKLKIKAVGGFIWMSEIDLHVTEAHGQIYNAAIPLSGNGGGVYSGATSICTANAEDNKFKYDVKRIESGANAGQWVVEFKVSLAELGIEQNLTGKDLEDLFVYYFTVGESDTATTPSGLVHPRNNTGRYPSTNWLLDETFDGANLFTYGDMLGDIRIDGKLDEKYWIANGKDGEGEANKKLAEYVDMIHVDGTNGTWDNESKYGNSFSYDYKIYAGEGYLYGAAIIDVDAVAGDKPYTYVDANGNNLPITRFDIWIDNNINEYDWLYDSADADYNDKTNINISKNIYVNEYLVGNSGENLPRAYNFQFYTNYYYNIYLVNNDDKGEVAAAVGAPAGSGNNQYVCGGSTPQTIVDPNYTTAQNKHLNITESNWHWGMSTVNGKTYVEFMIDLDNFYCDRSKGINYYVTATHVFDKDTTEQETLSLAYPPIQEENTAQPLWVSHVNSSGIIEDSEGVLTTNIVEGAGVIYTTDYIRDCDLSQYEDYSFYEWAEGGAWWYFALLRPVSGKTDQYTIVEIRNGLSDGKAVPFKNGDDVFQNGDIVYGFNRGNDYVRLEYNIDNSKRYDPENGIVNYVNDNELDMEKRVAMWSKGDVIKLNLSNDVTQYMESSGKGMADKHNVFLSQIGWNYDGQGEGSYPRRDMLWYEPAYVSQNSFELVSKSESRKAADLLEDTVYLPTTKNWDENNDVSIKPLKHFAPEVIKVDGLLNDAGWDEDQWIYVIETANGKLEYADVSTDVAYKTFFRYQLRTDGEYLYVGAEYPYINYADYNAPHFTLWIKSNDGANTWTHRYNIAYSADGSVTLKETDTQIADKDYIIDGETPVLVGPNNNASVDEKATLLQFENKLAFEYNDFDETYPNTVPNGLNKREGHGAYGDSALYGYTEEIQENQDDTGAYYPIIKTKKIYLGKESAEMGKNNRVGNETVALEFKVRLEEFGGVTVNGNNKQYNDFEYYVEAGYSNYNLFYPIVYAEPESERCYRPNYYPAWEWDSKNAAVVTAEDMQSGAIRMRNNCMPVVTLGAKISEEYVAPDAPNETCKAIRFGALYTEDYLRNWRKTDAKLVSSDDPNYNDMYTAETNDYWDIHEVGIAVLPTQLLEDENGEVVPLKMETEYVFTAPADNIVNWQCGSNVGGWSNFADYENFVFYITLWGIDGSEDMKFSFVPYVDFYASAGTETYYGETFVRSYNMIKDYAVSENGTEDDSSTPVLPDSSETPPPAENHPQESSIAFPSTSEESGN